MRRAASRRWIADASLFVGVWIAGVGAAMTGFWAFLWCLAAAFEAADPSR